MFRNKKNRRVNRLMKIDILESDSHIIVKSFKNVRCNNFPKGYCVIPHPYFYGKKSSSGQVTQLISGFSDIILEVGVKYSKEYFDHSLMFIRKAGNRLTELNKELEGMKSKTITI